MLVSGSFMALSGSCGAAWYTSQSVGSRFLALSLAVHKSYPVTSCGDSNLRSKVEFPCEARLTSSHLDHLLILFPSIAIEGICPLWESPPGFVALITARGPSSPISSTSWSCSAAPLLPTAVKTNLIKEESRPGGGGGAHKGGRKEAMGAGGRGDSGRGEDDGCEGGEVEGRGRRVEGGGEEGAGGELGGA